MLEKFEDILYGSQGGLLSGLIHLFQDYLPVSCITRLQGGALTFYPDCVSRPLRNMSPHGQGTHHATHPQVTKVDHSVCIRTSVYSHACVVPTYLLTV